MHGNCHHRGPAEEEVLEVLFAHSQSRFHAAVDMEAAEYARMNRRTDGLMGGWEDGGWMDG